MIKHKKDNYKNLLDAIKNVKYTDKILNEKLSNSKYTFSLKDFDEKGQIKKES